MPTWKKMNLNMIVTCFETLLAGEKQYLYVWGQTEYFPPEDVRMVCIFSRIVIVKYLSSSGNLGQFPGLKDLASEHEAQAI
jgi:hypothetical protein